MAAGRIQLLCMSCNVCMILYACSLQGASGDVPDDVVYTDLHKTVHRGDSVVLPCRFRGTPLAVYWKKGDDPETSPNLVSWIPTDDVTGLCEGVRPCQIMEMNENSSLVIKEVSIAEQGRYICRVTIKGILIHNFTDIRVFSPPMEPFPIINECQVVSPSNTETTCIISTNNSVKISCTASGYYPEIDLYFLHGSTSFHTKNTIEVTNLDGTKNKTIYAIASASESGYVCFASNIPGSQGQRTTNVLVHLPETPSPKPTGLTIPTVTRYRNQTNQTTVAPIDNTDGSVTKVVVAVIVVILILAAICVPIILWSRRKQRRKQRRNQELCFRTEKDNQELTLLPPDPQIKGKVSFFELWYLVHNMNKTNLNILRAALTDLQVEVPGIEEELTADKAYDLLCDWKDANTFDNEGMRLKIVLSGRGLGHFWKEMCERRYDANSVVSEELLDYVLWSIGDETKIRQFLRKLIPEKPETRSNVSRNKRDVIKEYLVVLREWRDGEHNESQIIQLSLALERAKCHPVDRTFFKVPEHPLKAISTQDVEGFIYRLTGRHCKRLAKAVGITDQKVITAIIYENNDDLFDTQSMIMDWVDGQECSNYEKRCRLDDAVIKIGRHDMKDSFGTTTHRVKTGGIVQRPHPDANNFNSTSIFNDDLHALLKHLPTAEISVLLERLGISIDEDRNDMEEKLRGWRDEHLRGSKACSLKELVLIPKDALNKTNNSNVLDLTDEELEDVFSSICSRKQMDQLTSGLGVDIKDESLTLQDLKEWRDSQDMEKRRETLRKTLHDMKLPGCIVNRRPPQHVYKAEMVRLAFSMLCTDVGPLAALLDMDTSKGKIVREPQKGTVGMLLQLLEGSRNSGTNRRRDFCVAIRDLGYLDVARLAYFDYDESLSVLYNVTSNLSQQEMEMLMKHLDSDRAVLSIGPAREQSGWTYDNLTLMKRWRNQFRPEPFHHSSKLVHGLRAIGRTGIADEVIGGLYQMMKMSLAVGIHICNSLEDDQLHRLYEHLGLHETEGQGDRTTTITTVVEWVRNCVKRFDKIPTLQGIVQNEFSFRKHENNELFKAGFVELAEEIMLLQYPRFPRII